MVIYKDALKASFFVRKNKKVGEKMQIIYKKLSEIVPSEKKPRRNDQAVKYVANSIKDFGFKIPIVIDKNNIVVCGHTRLKAAKKLKLNDIPCIIADDLTDEEIDAFRIADNKTAEHAQWNIKLLQEVIRKLPKFNFTDYGFDFQKVGEKENQRMRTYDNYNLDIVDEDTESTNAWDIPQLLPCDVEAIELIGFNEVLTSTNYDAGVHFYIDDYQFERIWSNPQKYIPELKKFKFVITPDFSLYTNMPRAMQLWNVYRSRAIGKLLQDNDIQVIPCIQFSDAKSYEFCFAGMPENSTLSLSSVGVMTDPYAL